MKELFPWALGVFLVAALAWRLLAPASGPSPARQLVADGALLVDVRTPGEFAAGHVEGARNVPVDQIAAADVGPKDGAVVVYCRSGGRSAAARATLEKRGYTRVYDLGAMSNW